MRYYISLKLSHFLDARVTEMENADGVMEEGIFIPLKKNGIKKRRSSISVGLWASELKRNTFSYSHCLRPYWGKGREWWKQLAQHGYYPQILGNMRPVYEKKRTIANLHNLADDKILDNILNKEADKNA